MSQPTQDMERLAELLAEEASTGLDHAADQELEELMAAGTGLGRDEFMTVASLVQMGFLHNDRRAQCRMPADLRQKIEQTATTFLSQGAAQNDPAPVADIRSARAQREEKSAKSSRWSSGPCTPTHASRCSPWGTTPRCRRWPAGPARSTTS